MLTLRPDEYHSSPTPRTNARVAAGGLIMGLTERDKLVLVRSLLTLLLMGVFLWAMYYSRWLAAVVWVLALTNKLFLKYWNR